MKQVVQSVGTGALEVLDVPAPLVRPGHVLIANERSLLSPGTERAAIELARKSLLGKARARPDQVRKVIRKARQEGLLETWRQVKRRLDEPMAMGYASAGTVIAVGDGVQTLRAGDRVASNGPHAEVVCVPVHLCARVPDGVSFDHAAFTVLGAIALHGLRLARTEIGETVFVVGLGLVGQLAVALAAASGCRVLATDLDARRCDLARRMGAEMARPGLTGADVEALTGTLGADAVLIAAATESRAPVDLAVEAVRKKGRVVLLGVAALELDRRPLFFKEAEFLVSCSYGPGRYDPRYEDAGHDYPAAYVRWTEQRNLQAVLDLMGRGRLDPGPLISHRYAVQEAEAAYELVEGGGEPFLGVLLQHAPDAEPPRTVTLRASTASGRLGLGCLGAGQYARNVLLPILARVRDVRLVALASAGGLSAADAGRKLGFERATTDEEDVLEDGEIHAVFVLTRHDQHARQVVRALERGKHVFVEKPLALSLEEIRSVEDALAAAPAGSLAVGFNRRYAPASRVVRDHFAPVAAPLTVSIRFNAGAIAEDHWTQDDATGGGRIVGEACHAVDLASFLCGDVPTRVFAESVGGPRAGTVRDDQAVITLRMAGGHVASIVYAASGDSALAKERVEVFGGGRAAVIDDWREVTLASDGRARRVRPRGGGKGQAQAIRAFLDGVRGSGATIPPWPVVRAVSAASVLAVRSLRDGCPLEIPGAGDGARD